MITEVEAYKGPKDLASHARDGRRTARVEPLYGEGGTVYVYFVYGMHWLLNFSTAGREKPEGVLIRGVLADRDGERTRVVGPGRVTRFLGIDKKLDGADVTRSKQLWLEDRGVRIPARHRKRGPRVGVDYAGPTWAAKPWRFWVDGGWCANEGRGRLPIEAGVNGLRIAGSAGGRTFAARRDGWRV
jgi:DNA-3-methyladenine glycosylase